MNAIYDSELYHFGVKGMKWGVRRYQNADGTLTNAGKKHYGIDDKKTEDYILKKGYELNSVGRDYYGEYNNKYQKGYPSSLAAQLSADYRLNQNRPLYAYDPKDKWDSKVYKGAFSIYLAKYRGAEAVSVYRYKTIKDLKMPSQEERKRQFTNLLKDEQTRKDVVNDLTDVHKWLVDYNVGNAKEREAYKRFDPNKPENDIVTAYSVFNHAMEASHAYKSTQKYVENMSKKYDAMVDDNNKGTYNDTHNPIVIFKANQALKTIGATPLSYLEAVSNEDDVRQHLESVGKHLKHSEGDWS